MRYSLIILLCVAPFFVMGQQHHIEVDHLKDNVYVYQSYADYNGNKVGANGILIELTDEVIIIDTPWDDFQTEELEKWVKKRLKKPISAFVITHAHADRIGGISYLKREKIKTISGELTAQAAAVAGYEVPDYTFDTDTLLNRKIRVFYPGPGHTTDNTAVYVENVNVLYGGCFLKSAGARDLGNIADANLKEWPNSIDRLKDKFPERDIVIPGHGRIIPGAIENTLRLLEETRSK